MSLKPEDFRYVEHRIISVSAENFVGPGKEKEKGRTRTTLKIGFGTPQDEAMRGALVELAVTIDGFLGDGRDASDRSFTATMVCLHAFKSKAPIVIPNGQLSSFLKYLVAQAYPVQLEKLKQIIHGMGFKGVNPDLGVKIDVIPEHLDPTEESAPRVKPRRRKAAGGGVRGD